MLVGIALGLTIDMIVPRAHAADDAAIVRVLTRIAVALEAGNRARNDR
jgi:hypothetical protein